MTNMRDSEEVISVLARAAQAMRSAEGRCGATQWLPQRGVLLATGDLHDNLQHLHAVQTLARLDESPDRHVILHELIHGETLTAGVDASYRMLVRVAEMVLQHPKQVHPMLANHELAQAGKWPITKGFGEQVQLFLDGLEWVFGDAATSVSDAVDDFIRAMPLVVRCANGVFCSHSTPAPFEQAQVDLTALDRELTADACAPWEGIAWRFTWGRGQEPESSTAFASALGANLMVCGHAPVEEGAEAVGPSLLLLNSDHARGVAVEISLEHPAPTAEELLSRVHYLALVGLPI